MTSQRILVLTENFPPKSGGSGRWFYELYKRLDITSIVVTNLMPNTHTNEVDFPCPIIRIPLQNQDWGFVKPSTLVFYLRTIYTLISIVKQHKITQIHCGRVLHEGVTGWIVKRLTGIQLVTYVHGEDVKTTCTSRQLYWLSKRVCAASDKIICNSENSKHEVSQLRLKQAKDVIILNPGVDTQIFKPVPYDINIRNQLGWDTRKVILTVGRLQARKGHDCAIRAMPKILEYHPQTLYAIVGTGEEYERLHQLVKALRLENSVVFMQEIDDELMVKCYQQCTIFILPNRTIGEDIEGFGMVLVEAQACAKPVIAGDSGGTKETMLVDQSGYIIDCADPEGIAEQIITLLSDDTLCEKLGNNGVEFVSKHLDWNPLSQQAMHIFSQIGK